VPAPRKRNPKLQATLAERAAMLRARSTSSETALWALLSGGKLGVSFRRQMPVGRYIADFVAPSVKLIVEVDGGVLEVRPHVSRVPSSTVRPRVGASERYA
jgi:very-short-patch-repair endonuclease